MNSKDFHTLQEAYLSVYESQSLEEGLRSAVKRLLGGKKKEVKASEPESRGAYLRRRYNVGPERSDTSAKRQILDRSRARKDRDEAKYGDSVYTKKVAQQSADAHDRYLRAGYSKYGADLKHGRGSKAAKRAAALQRENLEWIVDTLVNEGYDLSSYTWNDMYEICTEELADLYDVLFNHLLDEGYAETQEAAEAIMECMSEEWVDSILK
jgi:hypothetical protein